MFKRIFVFCIVMILTYSLSGCATWRSQKDTEIQGLRSEISVLKAQITAKDDEIESLREDLTRASAEQAKSTKSAISEVKSRPNTKQIQAALKNAGYNPGPIDGKMGSKTRAAIKSFQRDQGLKVDGKVGKITWGKLGAYLHKKSK